MVSQRDRVAMSPDEVAAFLAQESKVQVATVGHDGWPQLTTLFHVVRDGRVAFWTYGRSQKVVNLRRDPRITCLVEGGTAYDELRGVSIRGRAHLLEDHADVRALGMEVARRMAVAAGMGEDLGDWGEELVDQQARKRVGVVVEPEKVASWDHRKLAAGS